MNNNLKIIFTAYITVFFISCSKKEVTQPDVPVPVISNLTYDPNTVIIKLNSPTFIITGVINFENASGGVTKLMLTNSAGADIVVPIPPNTETSGQLTGMFEFAMPTTPGTYNFQIWIMDGKGNSSNKLSGSVQLIIEDRALGWSTVSQLWGLHRVTWVNNKYVAVGLNGVILNSSNGANWTARISGTTNTLYGVSWSDPLYVAVGSNKTILMSNDAINWTTRYSGDAGITFYGVAGTGSTFVAVGHDANDNKTVIYSTTDRWIWNESSFKVAGGTLNSVRWIGNQYVAVGGAFGYPLILTSPNGIEWTNRSSSLTVPGELADVSYSGSKYAAVGYGITAVSSDGINWSGNMTNWGSAGIVWSGNRFVASSIIGIMTSSDGINWIQTFSSLFPLRSITWSGIQYVAVGFVSPVILISP